MKIFNYALLMAIIMPYIYACEPHTPKLDELSDEELARLMESGVFAEEEPLMQESASYQNITQFRVPNQSFFQGYCGQHALANGIALAMNILEGRTPNNSLESRIRLMPILLKDDPNSWLNKILNYRRDISLKECAKITPPIVELDACLKQLEKGESYYPLGEWLQSDEIEYLYGKKPSRACVKFGKSTLPLGAQLEILPESIAEGLVGMARRHEFAIDFIVIEDPGILEFTGQDEAIRQFIHSNKNAVQIFIIGTMNYSGVLGESMKGTFGHWYTLVVAKHGHKIEYYVTDSLNKKRVKPEELDERIEKIRSIIESRP